MIAHTGFLLNARRLAPDTELPEFKTRRGNKVEGSAEDHEAWLPSDVGQRPISEKKLRKTVRKLTDQPDAREN